MCAVNRFSLIACAIVCLAQAAGCASAPSPTAAATSPAEADSIAIEAERSLAANDLAAAGRSYVRIVTGYPNHAQAWYRLGTIYLRTSQHHAAQNAFEQSLRADPNLSKAYANLAIAHLGQFRSAAQRAVASGQVADGNRRALMALLEDVNHALPPTVAPGASPRQPGQQ